MTRLLIVDDEPGVLNALRRQLERHGFEIVVALDARSAFAALEPFEPEVVLSDVKMPGTPGTELLDDMRLFRPQLHGVLMSGMTLPRTTDYPVVAKPWTEVSLLQALRGDLPSKVIYL